MRRRDRSDRGRNSISSAPATSRPRQPPQAINRKATNAALIKLNQVDTVTETIKAMNLCYGAVWRVMVSHRSGETTDDFIADLGVACGAGQIKSGAPCRGERLVKYNRLVWIKRPLERAACFENPLGGVAA